jgi:hypothetical protein
MTQKQNRPMSFSHAVARTARRPRHGPGPGFYFPTWADLGPVIVSRSSRIDGCTLLPADQNRCSGRNPSAHHSLSSLLLSLSCAAPQQLSDGRASDGRRTTASLWGPLPVRAHRWVDAPLSSGSSAGPSPCAPSWSSNCGGSSTHGSHGEPSTSGRRGPRACSGERRLRIYLQR